MGEVDSGGRGGNGTGGSNNGNSANGNGSGNGNNDELMGVIRDYHVGSKGHLPEKPDWWIFQPLKETTRTLSNG